MVRQAHHDKYAHNWPKCVSPTIYHGTWINRSHDTRCMFTVFAFLITFSALVLVHEAGHFFAARIRGVRVEEFGFGFPPRLFAKKVGETIYTLNLIPLGGVVKLYGENEADVKRGGSLDSARDDAAGVSFAARSFGEKMFIVLAGVGSNLLFTLAILSVLLSVGTTQPLTHLYPQAKIHAPRLVVTQVLAGSPAAKSDLHVGDLITNVNGRPILDARALAGLFQESEGQSIILDITRGQNHESISVTPKRLDAVDGRVAVGVGLETIATVSYPFWLSPAYAVAESWFLGKAMLSVLGSVVSKLFISHTTNNLGVTGPIGIAVMSGQVARMGFNAFAYFLALLSLNLALLNVLPLPALDGGRAAVILGERIAGRAIHHKLENAIQLIGVALILSLALLVTIQDLHIYLPMIANAFNSK